MKLVKAKSLLSIILTLGIIFGMLPSINVFATSDTKAELTEYEVYPIPQEVIYGTDSFKIDSVNLVLESELDIATVTKAKEALEKNNIPYTLSNSVDKSKTNILVGTHDSNGVVAAYFNENIEFTPEFFDNHDSYILNSKDNVISILGKDTDGAFYGLVTLKMILDQIKDGSIRNFRLNDFADTKIRGFIEGFYGIPWSDQDRMSLMEFGGNHKMTSYVFAPKDDSYHKGANAFNLYPEERLKDIAKMAEVGNMNKTRFVWTIHPFGTGDGRNPALYEQNLKKIIAKFEQLYSAGVRQFGVLGDDVGNLDRTYIINIMNALNDWRKSKSDVYELAFCPVGYNTSWANWGELNDYEYGIDGAKGFDEDIFIFWTGNSVIGTVNQDTVDNFRTRSIPEGAEKRREPLFWLNWPVIDYTWKRLLIGKGEIMKPGVEGLSGVVTNPMQEAEASKVALFAAADYSWNLDAFDDDISWENSFKYINSDASEDMYELAKHMSDPSPNGHGSNLGESETLKPLLDSFLEKLASGTNIKDDANILISEFDKIINAADNFTSKTTNKKLVQEMEPFAKSMKDLSLAINGYLQILIDNEDGNTGAIWGQYAQANSLDERSQTYARPHLTSGTTKIEPGSKRIVPFKKAILTAVTSITNEILDPSTVEKTFITSRTDAPTDSTDKAHDGSFATEITYKTPNSAKIGDYVGLTFSRPITLENFVFAMGNQTSEINATNTFLSGKVQYKTSTDDWTDIPEAIYNRPSTKTDLEGATYKMENLDISNVTGIRYIATADTTNIWLAIRDIQVNNSSHVDDKEINASVIKTSTFTQWGSNGDANILDGSDSTFAWYSTRTGDNTIVGDFIGLDLGGVHKLGKLHIVVGGDSASDHWDSYDLEYSINGIEYTIIDSYTQSTARKVIDLDLTSQDISARYVRIRNTKNKPNWVQFSEFNVKKAVESKLYTNANLDGITETKSLESTNVVSDGEITLNTGEYIGIKLDRIKDISEIVSNVPEGALLETSKNEVQWFDAGIKKNFEDARYIRIINDSENPVAFTLDLTVNSNEILPVTLVKNTFPGVGGNAESAFDQDRLTHVQFTGSQTKGFNFVYNLGQTISLDNLKFVSRDSEHDYPRHALISVSDDNENWVPVLELGNQDSENPGEATNEDDISYVLPDHEISYKTKSATDLGKIPVKYVKFECTRTKLGSNKWTGFVEIELNNNEYRATTTDPTIVSTDKGQLGYEIYNMIDGDVSTVYNSTSEKAGEFTYYFSENTDDINRVVFLQKPDAISNAKITAYVKSGTEFKWVDLGLLNSSYKTFDTSSYDNVLSVKATWENGYAPVIHEILADGFRPEDISEVPTYKVTFNTNGADEEPYPKFVESGTMISEPTSPTKAGYEFLGWYKESDTELFNFYEKITSDMVLSAAWHSKVEPETDLDTSLLDFMIKHADKLTEDGALEGVVEAVVKKFNEALTEAKVVLAKAESTPESVTQEEIDTATNNLIDTIHLLEFKGNKARLRNLVAFATPYEANKETYRPATYEVFEKAIKDARAVLADESALQDELDDTWQALADALADLRKIPNKDLLRKAIAKGNAINSALYTAESYTVLGTRLAEGDKVMKTDDDTIIKEDVETATKGINKAIEGLVLIPVADTTTTPSSTPTTKADDTTTAATTTAKANTKAAPKTGEAKTATISLILFFSMISLAFVLKRKKQTFNTK